MRKRVQSKNVIMVSIEVTIECIRWKITITTSYFTISVTLNILHHQYVSHYSHLIIHFRMATNPCMVFILLYFVSAYRSVAFGVYKFVMATIVQSFRTWFGSVCSIFASKQFSNESNEKKATIYWRPTHWHPKTDFGTGNVVYAMYNNVDKW